MNYNYIKNKNRIGLNKNYIYFILFTIFKFLYK